jgi:ATP-dependent Clp protease protease subunit
MYKRLFVDPRIRAKHEDLIDEPVIVFVQKFTEDAVKDFHEDLEDAHHTGQPCIPIVIDSYGGSVYGCLDMIAHVKKARLPVYTICTGKAMSAGAILFGMGKERYMAEHATLMLHDASSVAAGKSEEVKADARELERLNDLIFKLLAENCGVKDDYYLKLLHEKGHADYYLDAKKAKKHKLCTQIGVPELHTKIEVTHTFNFSALQAPKIW